MGDEKPTGDDRQRAIAELQRELDAAQKTIAELEQQIETTGRTLRDERDFAESLVNTAQVVVMVLDTWGCVLRVNPFFEQLTGYKKPKYIVFQQELPKTNVGKVLRRELRDAAIKATQKAA